MKRAAPWLAALILFGAVLLLLSKWLGASERERELREEIADVSAVREQLLEQRARDSTENRRVVDSLKNEERRRDTVIVVREIERDVTIAFSDSTFEGSLATAEVQLPSLVPPLTILWASVERERAQADSTITDLWSQYESADDRANQWESQYNAEYEAHGVTKAELALYIELDRVTNPPAFFQFLQDLPKYGAGAVVGGGIVCILKC